MLLLFLNDLVTQTQKLMAQCFLLIELFRNFRLVFVSQVPTLEVMLVEFGCEIGLRVLQRSLLLKFATGRTRLPVSLQVQPADAGTVDALPRAKGAWSRSSSCCRSRTGCRRGC